MDAARMAIESLYKGKCTVIEYRKSRDETTKQTKFAEMEVLHDQPCKLSYESITITADEGGKPKKQIVAKLFISPDVEIAEGSKIIVTQEKRTDAYNRSGAAAVYGSHQEIMLELFDGWA